MMSTETFFQSALSIFCVEFEYFLGDLCDSFSFYESKECQTDHPLSDVVTGYEQIFDVGEGFFVLSI